jgi:hypothetical protein
MNLAKLIVMNLILFFLIFGNLFAQEFKTISSNKNIFVKINVSTNTVIGDVLDYKITLEYSPAILLEKFSPVDSLGLFELKDYNVSSPKKKNFFNKNIVKKYHYKISTFLKGNYKISGLIINYKIYDKDYLVRTKEIPIRVTGVFDENNKKNYQLKDIKGMLSITDPKTYFLVGILLLIFAGCFYYYFIYKKKVSEKIIKNLPAHELAFRRLNDLKNSDLLANNEIKNFYVLLTEIFREYLENRYLVEVLDKTTYEIFYKLKEIEFDRTYLTEVREFLEESDLVKFAKYMPEEKTIKNHFDFVYDFVDKTKEIIIVEEKLTQN